MTVVRGTELGLTRVNRRNVKQTTYFAFQTLGDTMRGGKLEPLAKWAPPMLALSRGKTKMDRYWG